MAVDKIRNMEHPGTFRKIPENPGTSNNYDNYEKKCLLAWPFGALRLVTWHCFLFASRTNLTRNETMLVKKGQNNRIINLHDKTVIYTSKFVYIYIKIRIYIPGVMKTGPANLNFLCNFSQLPQCLILACLLLVKPRSRRLGGFLLCLRFIF